LDIPSFRLDRSALHVAIDMQRLFAEPTEWFVPWLPRILPQVTEIAQRHPNRTLLTRFIPPHHPDEMTGAWRDYYQRWRAMTRERLDPALLELVEPLRRSRLLPVFSTRASIPHLPTPAWLPHYAGTASRP
jgi:nicotinamidase-related amidase